MCKRATCILIFFLVCVETVLPLMTSLKIKMHFNQNVVLVGQNLDRMYHSPCFGKSCLAYNPTRSSNKRSAASVNTVWQEPLGLQPYSVFQQKVCCECEHGLARAAWLTTLLGLPTKGLLRV